MTSPSSYPTPPANLVQNRLTSLVGRSSGYLESLPPTIQHRITGLKGLQTKHSALEAEFQKDIFELEKKYAEKYRPLYERRKALVVGASEPTDEEVTKGEEEESDEEEDEDSEDEDEEEEEKKEKVRPTKDELEKGPKGIPEFWLTALKNHLGLSELITERDEECLKWLTDVRLEYPKEKPGFTLVFEFGKEAKGWFKNEVRSLSLLLKWRGVLTAFSIILDSREDLLLSRWSGIRGRFRLWPCCWNQDRLGWWKRFDCQNRDQEAKEQEYVFSIFV